MPGIRRLSSTAGYDVPHGDPLCHQEIAWFATEGDRVLGVVIRTSIDGDFSWVALEKDEEVWRAADLGASVRTQDEATRALHEAMQALGEAAKDKEPLL
jgi:hypothetical protein